MLQKHLQWLLLFRDTMKQSLPNFFFAVLRLATKRSCILSARYLRYFWVIAFHWSELCNCCFLSVKETVTQHHYSLFSFRFLLNYEQYLGSCTHAATHTLSNAPPQSNVNTQLHKYTALSPQSFQHTGSSRESSWEAESGRQSAHIRWAPMRLIMCHVFFCP